MQKLLAPREAANILGISYPTLKQWIYRGKLRTAKTPGGHHRVPESEIDRLFPKKLERGSIETRRGNFRKISGRNQLIGRVLDLKYSGLLAQVTLKIGEQQITAIITAGNSRSKREGELMSATAPAGISSRKSRMARRSTSYCRRTSSIRGSWKQRVWASREPFMNMPSGES